MLRRALWIVAGIVVVAAAVTYALIGNPLDPFDDQRFSSEAWRDGRARFGGDARSAMSRDLVRRVIRPGMSEKRVVELLGPPDFARDTRGPGGEHLADRRIYQYRLGGWNWLWIGQRMDDAFVYVHIDQSDHVVMAEIYGY